MGGLGGWWRRITGGHDGAMISDSAAPSGDPDLDQRDDGADGTTGEPRVRLLAFVRGHVQGVGFRWWTRMQAAELGLTGHARNLMDGRVEVQAQGSRQTCERLLDLLEEQPSLRRRPGRVTGVTANWLDPVVDKGRFLEY